MKRLVALSVLSASMLSSVVAHAATAELKLIGTITPAACVPNFAGGGTINYGNIPAGSLNATVQTDLPIKTTTISVVCDAPTKFALRSLDERATTVVDTLTVSSATVSQKFGLGAAPNGANIGAYAIQLTGGTSDRGAVPRMFSANDGATWATWGGLVRNNATTLMAWGDGVTPNVPAAHTSLTADISVVAAIDRASNLPLANEIDIDGVATFEVVYL